MMNLLDTTIPAQYLGLPARQVGYVPVRYQAKTPKQPPLKTNSTPRMTAAAHKRVKKLRDKGKTYVDIAIITGLTMGQVNYACRTKYLKREILFGTCSRCGEKKRVPRSALQQFRFCSIACRYLKDPADVA